VTCGQKIVEENCERHRWVGDCGHPLGAGN
jgi:hypothetical protein